jgi:hypothetical protein
MLASGSSVMQVLATQGGQVAQILQEANGGVGGALKTSQGARGGSSRPWGLAIGRASPRSAWRPSGPQSLMAVRGSTD